MDRIYIISYPGEYKGIESHIQEISLDEINAEIVPSTTHFLHDPKVLTNTDTVKLSPSRIFAEQKSARVGLPEEYMLDQKYNDFCPSRLLEDDSLVQIHRILDILEGNGIETVILSYHMIQPICRSPQELACIGEKCLDNIEDRLGIDDIRKEIREAVAGTSKRSDDSLIGELDDLESSEILDIRESYEETLKEKKQVYRKLRHSFIKGSGELIRDFNNEVIYRVKERGLNLKILPNILNSYKLDDKGIGEYARVLGLDIDLLEDSAEVFYDRSERNGGGLSRFLDPDKIATGAYFHTGFDEILGKRFIRYDIEEILILPKDIDDLPGILKKIDTWRDML